MPIKFLISGGSRDRKIFVEEVNKNLVTQTGEYYLTGIEGGDGKKPGGGIWGAEEGGKKFVGIWAGEGCRTLNRLEPHPICAPFHCSYQKNGGSLGTTPTFVTKTTVVPAIHTEFLKTDFGEPNLKSLEKSDGNHRYHTGRDFEGG